ncbi:pirin-like C-terminal cupin domain-containing protein [Thalassolituus sp. LLYu03]|uniref:pirin-like C-terminal cupin domain-containing protein n=1 Tax=Thalassolituus sp. LLYu03 TaxID=3421656 RepID=UPI003D2A20F5
MVFGKGDTLLLAAKTSTRAILLRGTPLREPVVHYGPFVMNTAEEIRQAIEDYNRGDFGRS